ncbi:MAG: hypothetical protein U0930_06230 [Pirellulales bacterium]
MINTRVLNQNDSLTNTQIGVPLVMPNQIGHQSSTVLLLLLTLTVGCDSLTDAMIPSSAKGQLSSSELKDSEAKYKQSNNANQQPQVASKGLFDVEFPTGDNWTKAMDGPVSGTTNSYTVVYVDQEHSAQCSVLVLPSLARFETLELMKDRWEAGFSEKFTRKLPSQSMTINGHQAHLAIGEIDSEAGTIQLAGILIVHPPHNYTLGITKLNSNVLADPELKQFINSFRIRN